jgi:hypothetical protein
MLADFVSRLRDLITPVPVALSGPAPQGQFVLGINLGGEAVTIEGNPWTAYDEALNQGLLIPGAQTIATSIKPVPYAGRAIHQMLNTAVVKAQTLEISQPLDNATYAVYLWLIENYKSDWHSLEVSLGDQIVATQVGRLPLGSWTRYGPYQIDVLNGLLKLTLSTHDPKVDAHLMGLSIFRLNP